MGHKCKHDQNHSACFILFCRRTCITSLGEISSRSRTGFRTQHCMQSNNRLSVVVVVVCHDQVRLQVSQGFRCRYSQTHELISPDFAIDPLVTSQPAVWCKRTGISHLVVKLHSLYRCPLVRQTPYACSPAIDDSVLTVVMRECIVVFG